MSNLKNEINYTHTKETDENISCPYNCNISIFKMQSSPRGNPENHYWEKTSQNETISCPGKTIHPLFKNDFQLLIPFLYSYQLLYPNLFGVRNYCPKHSSQCQLNLHRLILKRSRFRLKQPMLPKQQKMKVLPFHPLMLRRYSS